MGRLAGPRGAFEERSLENQIQLILSQIEELRSREAAEQDAAQAGAGDDPLRAPAQRASDAYAAIRDALDL